MTDTQQAERRAKRFWVSLVVGLLGLQLIAGVIAIRLATTDHSVAVVPDYHNAALNWDAEQASRTLSDRMGWTLQVDLSDTVDDSGLRAIRVSIRDKEGRNVNDLEVAATAFHHARGDDTISFGLQPVGGGQYQALAPVNRGGVWQLSFSFSIDDQTARVIRIMEVS